MKDYFVKYLPEKGPSYLDERLLKAKIQIKDGRLGRVTNLGLDTGMQFLELDDGTSLDSDDRIVGDYVVVEPYLCSKQIEKNDEITNDGVKFFTLGLFGEYLKKYCSYYDSYFKVIGIISPAADWIKEGDEFDEHEINILDECSNYNGKHMWRDCSCKTGFIKGVYLRDSSGHLK